MLNDIQNHTKISDDNNERNMNKQNSLSSFLPRLLEEYKEKSRPTPDDFSCANRSQPRLRSEQLTSSVLFDPSCASIDEMIRKSADDKYQQYQQEHHHEIAGVASVVSDNAKIPTTPLRQWSASRHSSEGYEDDKREISDSEINYDDDDLGTAAQMLRGENRESIEDHVHNNSDKEEGPTFLSFPRVTKRSNSFDPRRSVIGTTKNKFEKLRDHRSYRWSPDGVANLRLSSAPACVDNLPKQYARRPSL